MPKPSVVFCSDPPKFALHDDPALATDSHDLWLGYLRQDSLDDNTFAILRYSHLVDHRLSPINDEGRGEHKYSAGLQIYGFNEIVNSEEAERWKVLRIHHWVITFKDCTLDVLAEDCQVAVQSVEAPSALRAVVDHLLNFGAAQH